jgi:hypothetical protein
MVGDHLASGCLARRRRQRIIFARDLIEVLRRHQLEATSARLSAEMGLALPPKASTSSVASMSRRSWGRFAMLDGTRPPACPMAAGFGAKPSVGVRSHDARRAGQMELWAATRALSVMLDAPRSMLNRRAMVRWPHPSRVLGLRPHRRLRSVAARRVYPSRPSLEAQPSIPR